MMNCNECGAPLNLSCWNEDEECFICYDCGAFIELEVEIGEEEELTTLPCKCGHLVEDPHNNLRYGGDDEGWVCEDCFNLSHPDWKPTPGTAASTLICEMHRR